MRPCRAPSASRLTRGGLLLLGLVTTLAVLSGCATVPSSSEVQVLRKVGAGVGPVAPAGPVDGENPLDLVRGFVGACGSTLERHQAARQFLTGPAAASWDDAASLTVIDDQFDTVFAAPSRQPSTVTVRIRASRLGRLSASGAFQPDPGPAEIDVGVTLRDGQWRINHLPPGVVLRRVDFQANYKPVTVYFVDPFRRTTVPDPRYLPNTPATSLPSLAMDALLSGPSPALGGAAVSELRPGTVLRSNVSEAADGALVVDLTQLGEVDDGQRRLIAAQVVLTLAEVSMAPVRLLVDGVPLVTARPVWDREDVASLAPDVAPRPDVPGFMVSGGRLRLLGGGPEPGAAGDGSYQVTSAAMSSDGVWLAVAAGTEGHLRLLVGRSGGALSGIGVDGATMTRPTWSPGGNEVWTVLDGQTVARVLVDTGGGLQTGQVDDTALRALGPIEDLRMSRDGARVAAIVGGQLVVAAVSWGGSGEVALRNPRVLQAGNLTDLVGVDWQGVDQVVVASRRSDRPVASATVDGLGWSSLPSTNLTAPLSAVAAAPGRPVVVADQGGLWTFPDDGSGVWRSVLGGSPGAVPGYPG